MTRSRLHVITGFDGAAPPHPAGISLAGDQIAVRPWPPQCRDVTPGARLSFRVDNPTPSARTVDCVVDWETPEHVAYFDWVSLLFPDATEWSVLPATVAGNTTRFRLTLPPGVTHVAAHPDYGYGQALAYLRAACASPLVRHTVAGQSTEGRDIPVLVVDEPGAPASRRDAVIFARNHAYESAGSFCCEGMIDFLCACDPAAAALRQRYRFHFLPMTNPDGVYNGLTRLTCVGGADLNRVRPQDDPAWRALKTYVDAVPPALHLNLHNWLSKTQDGLMADTRELAESFRAHLPDLREDGKQWYVEWTALFLQRNGWEESPPEHKSWKNYVVEQFGGRGLTLEFPWHGRTTRRMRALGRQALCAWIAAVEDITA